MAENTITEENTTKSMENEMSEIPAVTSADDTAVSPDKKNHEQTNIDKPSTSKETSNVTTEKEEVEDTDSSEKQQNAFKNDCGDSKEETTLKTVSAESEISNSEKLECSNSDEFHSSEAKSEDVKEDTVIVSPMQNSLNEILKIVHGDLAMEMLQTVSESATVKDSEEENNEKEQQTVKKKDDISEDDMVADNVKKDCTISAAAKDKRDSRKEETEEKSNFGIVHPPTAIGELIEEQLANNSALSVDRTDHIVEWVKNSVKINTDEESNIAEECKIPDVYQEDTRNETERRRKLNTVTPPFVSPRKSQKIVSNIIKKSIKW